MWFVARSKNLGTRSTYVQRAQIYICFARTCNMSEIIYVDLKNCKFVGCKFFGAIINVGHIKQNVKQL